MRLCHRSRGVTWLVSNDAPDVHQNAAGIGWHQQIELAEGSSAETGCRSGSKGLLEGAECGLRRAEVAGHGLSCAGDPPRIQHIARALDAC